MTNYLNRMFFKAVDYLQLHQNSYTVILAAIIGVIGGYGAIGFRYLIYFFQGLFVSQGENLIHSLEMLPWYTKVIIPPLGGLVVGPLIYFLAREAKGHGVPEVMEAIVLHGGRIRPRVVFVKALASAITLGTGGSVGREGPIVQIGSAMGSTIGQLLKFSQQRIKTLVACGAAAGIAATFNAPIAGVFFSVEIILGNFAINTFSPIVVSSVLATVISHYYLGNTPAFTIPSYMLKSVWEFPLYLVLGVIIAGVGLIFMRSIVWMEKGFDHLRIPEYLKASVGVIPLGILLCWFPHIYGNGYETIGLAMAGSISFGMLLLLIPVKVFATSLTLGSGGSGGIFAPSIFIGAVTGGAFGHIVNVLWPSCTATSGAYALVGMAALVGCVTHAPVTSIIILFELTGDYQIILPLMFACIIATLITSNSYKDSIYTAKLSNRGIDLTVGLESTIMKQHIVRDVMHIDNITIDPTMPFENLFNHILNSKSEHFFVVGLDGMYLGEICLHRVSQIMRNEGLKSKRRALDVMNPSFPTVEPDHSLMHCVRVFGIHDVDELPVVDPETGKFVGVIKNSDIFALYRREVLRQGSLGLRFITKTEDETRNDFVNIPENYVVQLLSVTGKLANKSVKDLGLRQKYNVHIVAVRSASSSDLPAEIPSPDRILTRNDLLVVIGEQRDLARLRKELS